MFTNTLSKNNVVFENSYTLKIICISFIINKKTLIHLPAGVLMKSYFLPMFTQFVHALMEQDFGELAMRKPPYSMAFFPFRPKDGCSSIVELVNDIIFDIPSLVARCWPSTNGKYRSHD
jgi:hypothetical protein